MLLGTPKTIFTPVRATSTESGVHKQYTYGYYGEVLLFWLTLTRTGNYRSGFQDRIQAGLIS